MTFFYALAARRHRVAITPPRPSRDTAAPALWVVEADIGCPTKNASPKWHSVSNTHSSLQTICSSRPTGSIVKFKANSSAPLGQWGAWGAVDGLCTKNRYFNHLCCVWAERPVEGGCIWGWKWDTKSCPVHHRPANTATPWTPSGFGETGPAVTAAQLLLAGCAAALLSVTVSSSHRWAKVWSLSTSCLPTGSFHTIKKECESTWPRPPQHLTVTSH